MFETLFLSIVCVGRSDNVATVGVDAKLFCNKLA